MDSKAKFLSGEAYLKLALNIYATQDTVKHSWEGTEFAESFQFAFLTLLQFSCELYMKSILDDEGKSYIEHDLEKLFSEMNLQTQNEITANYDNRSENSQNSKAMFHFIETNFIGIVPKFSKIDFSMKTVLSTLKSDFINCRYYREEKFRVERLAREVNYNLISVLYATRAYVLSKHPDWPRVI